MVLEGLYSLGELGRGKDGRELEIRGVNVCTRH